MSRFAKLADRWQVEAEEHAVAADHTRGDGDELGRWAMGEVHAAKAEALRRCAAELRNALGDA